MAYFQQLKTFFPTRTEYTLDENKDNVEFGFPIFRSRPDHDTGMISHIYLILKHGSKATQIRRFFQRKRESIQQANGTVFDLRDVALDYYFGLGRPGYEDVSLGNEPKLNFEELNYINKERKAKKMLDKSIAI